MTPPLEDRIAAEAQHLRDRLALAWAAVPTEYRGHLEAAVDRVIAPLAQQLAALDGIRAKLGHEPTIAGLDEAVALAARTAEQVAQVPGHGPVAAVLEEVVDRLVGGRDA